MFKNVNISKYFSPVPHADDLAWLVDAEWYNFLYPDLRVGGLNVVEHYTEHGYKENRSPNPFFDAEFYLKENPDVIAAGYSAIQHYLEHGFKEGRRPCGWLDSDKYFREYVADGFDLSNGAMLRELLSGTERGRAIHFLSSRHYARQADCVFEGTLDALRHFLMYGIAEGHDPHPLIELKRLHLTGSVKEKITQFRKLFESSGEVHHISTHELVRPEFYMKKHGKTKVHPVVDYLATWETLNRWVHPLFDGTYYSSAAELADDQEPLSHYATQSFDTSLRPNKFFDPGHYMRNYGQKLLPDQHPLNHYLEWGHTIWFHPSEDFGQSYYLQQRPYLEQATECALADYLHGGEASGVMPLPPKPFFDKTESLSAADVVDLIKGIARSPRVKPVVSVIVPAYENLKYTLRAVYAVLESDDETAFEVIIVDDQSPDGSGKFLKESLGELSNVKVIINKKNLGFLRSCNAAVEHASGDYLCFLNNDTAVLPGWLDELVGSFERNPTAGLVGSKLIYPNGLLQEAGGVIWDRGECANFGRLQDPLLPEYNYERDVDYISGAAIMIPSKVWESLGGFSEELSPAYYEDTDFAMKVRAAGKRVIYQPLSVVVHYEGISSGTDLSSGVKKYQEINKSKFAERWRNVLASHGEPGDLSLGMVDRCPKARILIFDAEVPMPDRDSGSITAFFYMKLLTELGYRVTFVASNLSWAGKYSRALQRIGVRIIHKPYVDNAHQYMLEHGGNFDLFILSRAPHGGAFFERLKAAFPSTPIVFDTVDLHHLRMERQVSFEGSEELIQAGRDMKELELKVIRKADATLLVSDFEVKYLHDEIGPFPSLVIPLIYESYERSNGFKERKDIAFVGGYQHTPNVDAVEYLLEVIWPIYRKKNTGARLHIVGSNMPEAFHDYADEDVIVTGFVEDLEAYLEGIRLTVAPLRYGAGVKGKVGNSLRMGVPVVATSLAAEGMGLVGGAHIEVADSAVDFADSMERVYTDESRWSAMSKDGQIFVSEKFGMSAAKSKLKMLVDGLVTKSEAK